MTAPTSKPQIGIAVFHGLGDVLNLTPVARQLRADHPGAHLVWFVSKGCEPALRGNPDLDEIVVLEGTWEALDAGIPELARSRPFAAFHAPAPYLNYDKAPGGSLWDLYRAAPGLRWTVPMVPVLSLSDAERAQAAAWWEALPSGPRILVECDQRSQQSFWTVDTVEVVWDALRRLDPLFVMSAAQEPGEAQRLRALGARVAVCTQPWRLNAEFYNRCDAFLGISSGISALTGSTACRDDVPSVEYVRGEHWSTAGLNRHRRRRHAFSLTRYREALRALALELSGGAHRADLEEHVRVLGYAPDGKQILACPCCDGETAEPFRGEDIVRCSGCNLVYLRVRPTREALEAYYRDVYAVGEPTAAPPVKVPASVEAALQEPGNRAARRDPLVEEALRVLGRPGRRLVDVGCGWGPLLVGARERGLEVTGFEFTAPNVAFGRERLGLDIRSQPFPEGDLAEGSVDVVTFSHSLEHVPDPLTYLQKAAHVLTEGGVLMVVVPNINSLCAQAMGEGWPWLERDWHYTHFTPETLRAMALQAGLEVVTCRTVSGDFGEDLPLRVVQALEPNRSPEEQRQLLGRLEAMGHGEEVRLVARKRAGYLGRLEPAAAPERILWVRPDSIGDVLLSNDLLESLHQAHPAAKVAVVCQAFAAPVFESCPFVAEVIPFDRGRLAQDPTALNEVLVHVATFQADLCVHSVHSREGLGDVFTLASGAPVRVGVSGDLCNMSPEEHHQGDGIYTRLIPPLPAADREVDRLAAFAQAMGWPRPKGLPQVWLTQGDRDQAEAYLTGHGLQAGTFLAVFPGAQYAPRRYGRYGEALKAVLTGAPRPVVALGTGGERDLCDTVLEGLPGPTHNAAGALPLRASLALLAQAGAAVGAESGLAQACVALGIPHAVVTGGGHFGRFLPYSALTTLVVNPLTCFLCNWSCPHARTHCITDVDVAVLAAAVAAVLAGPGPRPRIFVSEALPGGPEPFDLAAAVQGADLEVIRPGSKPEALPAQRGEASPEPQLTVICGVWHKDPHRHELVRGHLACLRAQSRPVRALYVFDGGDLPPADFEGEYVATRQPLALYEAWDLAIQAVRTPYVMNLNLDDRLCPDAAEAVLEALEAGADLVGGEWRICFSQEETDGTRAGERVEDLPFHPDWPPVTGRPVRLGSGTGERGTYGPGTAWRMALHRELPHYPWRFEDGSPVRVIGDGLWWELLGQAGKKRVRLRRVLGHYHSHPGGQAEFRNPEAGEWARLQAVGVRVT